MQKRTLKLAGALCAGLTMALCGAGYAQTTAPNPLTFPTQGDTISTGPIDSSVNYTNEFNINGFDLDNAKTAHYSDKQIATMYKISEITGQPFSAIIAQVKNGYTFIYIANKYGFNYNELKNVKKQENAITQFRAAQAASGFASIKRPNALGKGMSDPGSQSFVLSPPMTSNM